MTKADRERIKQRAAELKQASPAVDSPTDRIPASEQILERLSVLSRERLLLKDLLKLARRKEQQFPQTRDG